MHLSFGITFTWCWGGESAFSSCRIKTHYCSREENMVNSTLDLKNV